VSSATQVTVTAPTVNVAGTGTVNVDGKGTVNITGGSVKLNC